MAKIGISLPFRFVQSQRAYDGQALGEIETQLTPLEDISPRQAQEVARACIVDIEGRPIEVAGPPRVGADLAALVDEGEMGGVLVPGLCFEVQAWLARERRHQGRDHGRQQRQERRVAVVFAAGPGLAEGGFVGEGAQRVDVGEEVVDEGVYGRERADGLGREVCGLRRLQLGQRMGGIGGRLR